MTDIEIPVVDLNAGDDARIAARIDEACRDVGFFCVAGHGVPEDLIARTREQAGAFFALPVEDKLKVKRPPQKISRGYNPFGERSLSYSLGLESPPDLHEAFAYGPENPLSVAQPANADDAMQAANLWPAEPAEFHATMVEYYKAMTGFGNRVLRIMTHALNLDEDFFIDKFDHQSSAVRLIHYPALDTEPEEGQLRAGVHTDYGALTFVRSDDVPGRLQVKLRNGGWIEAQAPPGTFACNISDAMMRWTNDRWVSTLHRVGNPPPGAEQHSRISLVFFHMPNHDAVIRCLPGCAGENGSERHPPITFTEHYLGKVMKASHRRIDAGLADATAQ